MSKTQKTEPEKKEVQPKTKPKGSQKKSVSKSSINDFNRYALVSQSIPIQPGGPVMDGTSVTEISQMANQKYSAEIIGDVRKFFNLTKLTKLKDTNAVKYLDESKKQINTLWHSIESLVTHTNLFLVACLIGMGIILNDTEEYFGQKGKYMRWLKDNFGHKRMRYFQQAKQLARMGDFAKSFAALGKNRLLEYDRLITDDSQSHMDLLNAYPFQDITADFDGEVFKIHIDTIITLHRFADAEIDFIDYDQAFLIASILGQSIPVKKVANINDWLKEQGNKQQALDDLIMNKMVFPSDDAPVQQAEESLNSLLAGLIKYNDEANIEDDEWISEQKGEISEGIILQAHELIVALAEKFEIDLSASNTNEDN